MAPTFRKGGVRRGYGLRPLRLDKRVDTSRLALRLPCARIVRDVIMLSTGPGKERQWDNQHRESLASLVGGMA